MCIRDRNREGPYNIRSIYVYWYIGIKVGASSNGDAAFYKRHHSHLGTYLSIAHSKAVWQIEPSSFTI